MRGTVELQPQTDCQIMILLLRLFVQDKLFNVSCDVVLLFGSLEALLSKTQLNYLYIKRRHLSVTFMMLGFVHL